MWLSQQSRNFRLSHAETTELQGLCVDLGVELQWKTLHIVRWLSSGEHDDDDVGLPVLGGRVDILGTNCNAVVSNTIEDIHCALTA